VKKMSDARASIFSRRSRGSLNRSVAISPSSALVGAGREVKGTLLNVPEGYVRSLHQVTQIHFFHASRHRVVQLPSRPPPDI
jgi:hypothetical protein